MGDVFKKRATPHEIATEAASLRWLAAADGIAVVPLEEVDIAAGWLTTTRITPTAATKKLAYEAGIGLAHTHAAGAPHFGAPPPTLTTPGRFAGITLPMSEDVCSWGEFYARDRCLPYLHIARDAGALTQAQTRRCERVIARIAADEFTSPLPQACRQARVRAARTHGDLWGGNLMWGHLATEPTSVRGWLIDPAAHGGHAETDLAALALFGSPYLTDLIAGYQSVSPLSSQWQARVGIHQFHMLLVHAALFGGGYGAHVSAVAQQYC
ncbi:MAG: fructosamine kinase family protein [Bowdeniella nasicola]|nr:fructosamine kinase family protein [Bowdeniella nasicola]